jgi:hypothetical protein
LRGSCSREGFAGCAAVTVRAVMAVSLPGVVDCATDRARTELVLPSRPG